MTLISFCDCKAGNAHTSDFCPFCHNQLSPLLLPEIEFRHGEGLCDTIRQAASREVRR